jgi:hypothetical protein
MRFFKTVATIFTAFFISVSFPFAGAQANGCSIYDAVYKPHPSQFPDVPILKKPKALDFEMTVHRPLQGEKGGSHRAIFFYIDAFDHNTSKKVSTLRMADVCSTGMVVCEINTNEGQFHPNDRMKELRDGLAFAPIALTRDFGRVEYYSRTAPYVFILPDTLRQLYTFLNKPNYRAAGKLRDFDTIAGEFVRFYTQDKIFPDFSGNDVWVFDRCNSSSSKTDKPE